MLLGAMQALYASFFFFVTFLTLLVSTLQIGEFYVSLGLLNSAPVDLIFVVDLYALGFSTVVSLISASVMVFCSYYMEGEDYKGRFVWLMGLFVASMFILLFSGSMSSLMVGWDGLGATSFLLVVYYNSKSSVSAGMITSLTNRIGDILLMICMGLMAGTMAFNFGEALESGLPAILSFMLVIAAMTKSAQIPFSSWLPAAMAAPTPVSTLVHSSTLVTAGLFVIIRFSSGLEGVPMHTLLVVSSFLTCFMGGSCALLEPDLKKIVAFSTLSQLGLMGFSLSFGLKDLAFFHLVVHALFKALMFMCVGSAITAGLGVQDSRLFSGLYYKMPFISMWLVISCLSLSGFPLLSGFFSKDLLMEGVLGGPLSSMSAFCVYITCLLTAAYSFRLVALLFAEDGGQPFSGPLESPLHYFSTSFLGVGSVLGASFFQSFTISFNVYCSSDLGMKMAVFFSMSTGVFLLSVFEISLLPLIPEFLSKMFFFKSLSGSFLSGAFMKMGNLSESVDLNMEMYLGEGATRSGVKLSMKYLGWSVHWAFYFWFQLLVILFVMGMFYLM